MRTFNYLISVLVLLFIYSCDDIIEKDITNDLITISYPQNNAQIENNVVNFQWGELDGASNYRIQIFSFNQNMVLDSIVSNNNFIHPLNPGSYQWRVRGENFAYQTAFTFPYNFTLIQTSDLTNQVVLLNSPAAGSYIQNSTPFFSWSRLNAAETYTFELMNVTAGNIILHYKTGLTDNTYTPDNVFLTQEGQYQWKVKAVNADSQTDFAVRNFYIDKTAPNLPQNFLPANNITINQGVLNFSWSAPQEMGIVSAPLMYQLQIANDQGFTTIVQSENVTNTSYSYNFTSSGTYYWRVKAYDLAGNHGNFSAGAKITIQ